MPFSLPAKSVAWNRSLLNRCAYSSVNQAAGDVMYKVANELITTRGFTCKGSCDGVTGAMDGVFRWASGNSAKTRFNGSAGAQSWVAITLAGGRGDVVFSYNAAADDIYNIWWSPGGIALAAGTPAQEPTATDKVLLNKWYTGSGVMGTIVGSTAANDRLVSIWSRPDKGGFRVAVASNGSWQSLFGVDVFTADTYGAGITVLDCTAFYVNGAFDGNNNSPYLAMLNSGNDINNAAAGQKRFAGRRTDGGGTTLDLANKMKVVGQTTAGTAASSGFDGGFAPELQGGATYTMKRLGLYSVTTSHRGDVGTLLDWYISRNLATINNGDTAGTLDWICVNKTCSYWWDWDSATPVVMS